VLALPSKVRTGMHLSNRGGVPHWPPYYAPALNGEKGVKGLTQPDQVVFSDQPWAVAWYADRISIWLPPTREGFQKLETVANDLQTPVAGILISPSSHGSGPVSEVANLYPHPGHHTSLPLPPTARRHGHDLLQRKGPRQ
jgi:hypothetical protein